MPDHPLVSDIYTAIKGGVEVTAEQAERFGKTLSDLVTDRLKERMEGERKFTLRMSNLGKGARQLWYSKHYGDGEELSGKTLLKFLIGDIHEAVLLFLAEVSGHKVTEHQAEVSLGGIKGHIDADIDGVTVDVKSASPYSFKKFQDGSLVDNDAFGYIEQISGYSKARGTAGAFLASDKVSGELTYLEFPKEDLAVFRIEDRIEYLKTALESESETEPERCYSDEPDGASGNRKLGVNCSYCSHKFRCWQDANGGLGLRVFNYSTGPRFLTNVAVEPKVYEIPQF